MTRFSPLIALLLASAASADTITLRPSVRWSGAEATVHLADIASIEGEEAARYADLVIIDQLDASQVTEISVRLIRDRLDEAGAHWGRIHLRGRTTLIRPRSGIFPAAPQANAALTINSKTHETGSVMRESTSRKIILAASLVDNSDLGGVIARWFAHHLQVKPENLKLTISSRALDLFGLSTGDFRFEIQPQGSLRSERIGLTVRQWRGGLVQATHDITVNPTLRHTVARLTRDLSRKEIITGADIEPVEQWVSPLQQTLLAPPESSLGRVAGRALRAGDFLRHQQLKQETVVRRGDPVTVRCLVGGLVVTQQAVAREDGGRGDAIELRGRRERENFTATITGPGQAIVNLSRSGPGLTTMVK